MSWAALGLAVVAAAVYLPRMARGRRGPLKLLPAALCALAVWPQGLLFTVGYLLCGLGDWFLLDKERWFLHGLVAFLAGHVALLAAFVAGSTAGPPDWLVLGLGVVAALLLRALMPHLRGKLRLAVPLYTLALVAMAASAAAWSPLAGVGGALFVFSDGVLAWNRFRRPFRGAEGVILSSYYGALSVMAAGILLRP